MLLLMLMLFLSVMGPDLTDYAMVKSGGRRGDMRLGDGGQAAVHDGAGFEETIKRLWLFVRASLLPLAVCRDTAVELTHSCWA